MGTINLLPWRKWLHVHQIRTVKRLAYGSAAFMLSLACLAHVVMRYVEGGWVERVDALKESLVEIEAAQKRRQESSAIETSEQRQYTHTFLKEAALFFNALGKRDNTALC